MAVPTNPKIYHIVHCDRLPSIVSDGVILSYADFLARGEHGTTIGMLDIKQRRLKLELVSRPNLMVGSCVPFYFCPRSVMLYLMSKGNHPNLNYRGGQGPIVHIEADLRRTVDWAERTQRRWAFTLSNAASNYFEDRASLDNLNEIDWDAVNARSWSGRQEAKQAEFLLEGSFPWSLVDRIGVLNRPMYEQVVQIRQASDHRPPVDIQPSWYY